jgi:hypothetical protein
MFINKDVDNMKSTKTCISCGTSKEWLFEDNSSTCTMCIDRQNKQKRLRELAGNGATWY